MNFAEFEFWVYLIAALIVLLSLKAVGGLVAQYFSRSIGWYDRAALLLLGLFLLGCVNPLTLAIFLAVSLITFGGLTLFLRGKFRWKWLALSLLVVIQLLPLLYYKYSNFFINGVIGGEFNTLKDLIIPVGLSFYTFQLIGFLVDTVIYKKPLPQFLDFMNFAGFFPQIVAGPIERRESLLPQMEQFRFRWNSMDINAGVSWLVLGLFLKVCLADNLANYFDPAAVDNPFLIWLNNLIFGLRIYYDFAGYSFIALGVARCLGVQLTLNFASPYISCSTQEFWRRWHITLSTWFRDYLYIPMGGGRTRCWAINVMIVFVVSGIWHGAGWGFILWGAVWGGGLIFWRKCINFRVPPLLGWGATMLIAFFAWLFFYETRSDILWLKLATLFSPDHYTYDALEVAYKSLDGSGWFVLAGIFSLVLVTHVLEWASIRFCGEPYSLLRKPLVLSIIILLTILLAPSEKNDFIYFAF